MRVSTAKGDPGYTDLVCSCPLVKVFLEGSERSNVVTADEEARYAKLYKLDSNGMLIANGDEIMTEDFHGHVRIECPDWLRAEIEAKKG